MTIQPNDLINDVMSTFYISGELVHEKMILFENDLFYIRYLLTFFLLRFLFHVPGSPIIVLDYVLTIYTLYSNK